jgi:sulfotransferase family protein
MSAWRPASRPAFVFSTIRSGSTLFRCLLDSHSRIHAPHELHLDHLRVTHASAYVEGAMRHMGLAPDDLEAVLRDGIYRLLLQRSGKDVLVDKSPSAVAHWKRVLATWPAAPIIVLRRDPAASARSVAECGDGRNEDEAVADICTAIREIDAAHETRPDALVIRYEELVADPAAELEKVCAHLGVAFERTMVDYGRVPRTFEYGIGDWGPTIRSGRIQPADRRRLDSRAWPDLVEACLSWGYPPPAG